MEFGISKFDARFAVFTGTHYITSSRCTTLQLAYYTLYTYYILLLYYTIALYGIIILSKYYPLAPLTKIHPSTPSISCDASRCHVINDLLPYGGGY